MPWLASFMPETADGSEPIDLLFAPRPEKLFALVDSYGAEGRNLYALFELTADLIYPIIYATFLAITLTLLARRLYGAQSRATIINIVPFGIVIADYLENMGIVMLLMTYPEKISWAAWATSFFNAAKWSLVGGTFALIVIGLVLLPFRRAERVA